jgi:hypothetical protein
VIPGAPPFHSLRFRLHPWSVRGGRVPAAGAARRGRGAPPPSPRAMMVIRELHSVGSPPSSPSPAQASALPSIPELSSSERAHLRPCSGEELPRRTDGRSCTGGELTRWPWPRPTTSASAPPPRPPASSPHQGASSPASIGGASHPQPQPQKFVVGRQRRRRGEAPAAAAGAHGGGRHRFFYVVTIVYWCCNDVLACCNWSHS